MHTKNAKIIYQFLKEWEDVSHSTSLELYNIILEQIKVALPDKQKHLATSLNECHNEIIKSREKNMYEKGFIDGSEITRKIYKKRLINISKRQRII